MPLASRAVIKGMHCHVQPDSILFKEKDGAEEIAQSIDGNFGLLVQLMEVR